MKRLILVAVGVLLVVLIAKVSTVSVSTPVALAGPITPTGWRPPACNAGSGIAATGSGLAYQCAAISSGSGAANTIPKWTNGSGALGNSVATDTGSLFTIPEAFTQTGTTNINTSSAVATNIGATPSTSGNFSVDIEAGSASNSGGVFIAANFTNGAPVSIGSTSSGTVLIESGANMTLDAKHIITKATGSPSASCSSGSIACASGVTCTDASGIYTLTGASGCTITFANSYNSTPACEITLGSSSAVGWAAIQTQSASAVKFSPENSSGFVTVTASASYLCVGTN